MGQELHHNGEYVIVKNHRIHIFRAGNGNGPKLVFLSGSGTVAPVYDFKILYQKLLNDFKESLVTYLSRPRLYVELPEDEVDVEEIG